MPTTKTAYVPPDNFGDKKGLAINHTAAAPQSTVDKVAGLRSETPRALTRDESPPVDNAAFDTYVLREGFQAIQSVMIMEAFLLSAAQRCVALRHESDGLDDDDALEAFHQSDRGRALLILEDWFCLQSSDLAMFFQETSDYWEQPKQVRNRLRQFAETLVGSVGHPDRIDRARQIAVWHSESR